MTNSVVTCAYTASDLVTRNQSNVLAILDKNGQALSQLKHRGKPLYVNCALTNTGSSILTEAATVLSFLVPLIPSCWTCLVKASTLSSCQQA